MDLKPEKYKGYEIHFEKDPTGMVAGKVSHSGMFEGWQMGQTKEEAFNRIKNNIDWVENNKGKGYNFVDAKHMNHSDPAKAEAKKMLMWNEKVGKNISVELSSGDIVKGKLYSVTHDVWKPKRTPQETLNVRSGDMAYHFRSNEIKKIN